MAEHMEDLTAHESHQPGEGNGCVTRCLYTEKNGKLVCNFAGHNHKENGFNYQKAAESSWYNLDLFHAGEAQDRFRAIFTVPFKQAHRDPLRTDKVWHMGAGPYAGLNFIGSDWWPYVNNAHHIVPVDDVLSKILDEEELKVLQIGKYNVHKGVNIIYLPKSSRHGRLYYLLKHPKYHSTYSMQVRNQVKAIKARLKQAADDENEGHPEVTEENAPQLGDQLHSFSLRTRKDIRAAGELQPGAHLNELYNLISSR
ncbi:MAG TPA: AHH domain-containing protein [Polyangia bacterium]